MTIATITLLVEQIDILFDEAIEEQISESGSYYELDFDRDAYIDSFTVQEKVQYVLKYHQIKY